MKKVKILLSSVAVVAIVAAVTASSARVNVKVYTEDAPGSKNCPVTSFLTQRTLGVADPINGINATLIPGPCLTKYQTLATSHD
ncbi:hypothetical protein HF324_14900 [Chitinophaga oryzae]|uniref:Secreted protein n=1 Tax=Chitinophaga oryzae TaxID=2725414 RepID=A0ABX6LG10_9BACT|nr:hypothetical protein [Chitinophaga oryzae]QJB39080.1 hypothetical protein HF324_14900 [Chitinophaga oryzae]